ncbi:glycosyltransferase family 2 protein [Rhodococcus tukisamuensis]|uniref:Glycosyl transferase family 2 n=1 Tax=Rhodococcus tukisamuensis TaxID=168276 RepID=A0A1G7AMZ1_9NOCA|nr:glycosyltransferase [Rhodococcus tukisamuensis]SDE15827.1 Glycosyl transferase family 2 [Rhodococcus tukisamuensis]
MPRVTVCVPAYNCERTIDTCLASALQQSYSDFECLVIDNASTDSTFDRVMAYKDPRIRALRNAENIGPSANHNRCIQHASGDLIQFLHSDDRLLPDCLSRLVPAFDDPRVGLAFARRRIESSDEKWIELFGTLHTQLEPLEYVNDGTNIIRKYVNKGSNGNWIGEPTSVMVRRSTLMEVGGFSSELRYSADIELWLRILARSDAAWVDSELSVRVQNEGTLTALFAKNDEAWLDRLWTLSGLARNRDLERRIRIKARRQWIISVLKKGVRAQLAPAEIRPMKYKQLGRHIRQSLNADPSSNNASLDM